MEVALERRLPLLFLDLYPGRFSKHGVFQPTEHTEHIIVYFQAILLGNFKKKKKRQAILFLMTFKRNPKSY